MRISKKEFDQETKSDTYIYKIAVETYLTGTHYIFKNNNKTLIWITIVASFRTSKNNS